MTSFILLQRVPYEGSTLKGVFSSLEAALDHIDELDGYCMDEFICDRESMHALDGSDFVNVENATFGWHVDGPADLSFEIYACAVSHAA